MGVVPREVRKIERPHSAYTGRLSPPFTLHRQVLSRRACCLAVARFSQPKTSFFTPFFVLCVPRSAFLLARVATNTRQFVPWFRPPRAASTCSLRTTAWRTPSLFRTRFASSRPPASRPAQACLAGTRRRWPPLRPTRVLPWAGSGRCPMAEVQYWWLHSSRSWALCKTLEAVAGWGCGWRFRACSRTREIIRRREAPDLPSQSECSFSGFEEGIALPGVRRRAGGGGGFAGEEIATLIMHQVHCVPSPKSWGYSLDPAFLQ